MLCFIAVMLLVAATAWAADYPVAHGANEQIAHATHYPKMVSVKGTQTPECKLENIAMAPKVIHTPTAATALRECGGLLNFNEPLEFFT